MKAVLQSACLLAALVPLAAPALTFSFNPLNAIPAGAQAAIDRAAAQWATRIADPVSVNVSISFEDLGDPSVIANASTFELITNVDGYEFVRGLLVADAAAEPDDAIVAALPLGADLGFTLPGGFTLDTGAGGTQPNVIGAKANFKALGVTGLDGLFGATDAIIRFNSGFNFDFDNSNGVSGMDLETVAAHELGHALGFISTVDTVDFLLDQGLSGAVAPRLLDLFRFAAGAAPSTQADFSTFARELRPGIAAVFDDVDQSFALSEGAFTGDGRQASHFKDDSLTGTHLGLLDPTLAFGTVFTVTEADLRVLDLIGYDIVPIPLGPALPLLLSGLAALWVHVRPRWRSS